MTRDTLRPMQEIIEAHLGREVSASTLRRWREIGVQGVRLKCVPVDRTWLTTEADFDAFARELAAVREGHR